MLFILLLGACGAESSSTSDDSGSNKKEEVKSKGKLEKEDFLKIFGDPKKYKGYEVEYTGKVFIEPERDDDGVYLQVWADPENSENNSLVAYNDPDFQVDKSDYVKISGVVDDLFKGKNTFGATIEAPVILASSIEVVDYVTAVSPAIKTIEVNQNIDQHGYVMNLEKIEFAENQTRVYLKITNNSEEDISFFTHSAKLIAENKQIEVERFFEANLPELQSKLLPGIESEGVITFPAVDTNINVMKFHAEGRSNDFKKKFTPFVFDINLE